MWRHLKHKLAATFLDAPRYGLALRSLRPGWNWVGLHNRGQRLGRRPGQRGVYVDNDPWTSALFYPQAYPRVGWRVMRAALSEWPISFRSEPIEPLARQPEVSFIIGHRGQKKIPHLLTTIRSLAAQREAAIECLVVEQADTPELPAVLPAWVRHVHTPLPFPDMPYSRAWAFNRGALAARGEYLVFHDNDICVPERYAHELVSVFRRGFEAARLQRFVFNLCDTHSRGIMESTSEMTAQPPLEIVQNCEGHTLAVRRDVYFAVGGHDESFLGWGGEDNEMFHRLRTRRLHDCAYLPFVHLYHAPQPGKGAGHVNTDYFRARMRVPASERIAELTARGFGREQGPDPQPSFR